MSELDPIHPDEALDLYLQDITGDLSPNTVQARRYQLGFFTDWCERRGIEPMSELGGREFHEYKQQRGEDIGTVTLRSNMVALRLLVRFCISLGAMESGADERINVPQLDDGEKVRKSFLAPKSADEVGSYLGQFEYASVGHVLFILQWRGGMRMGACHSIDLDDLDDEKSQVELHHRPDEGTRLKNGYDGERIVSFDAESMAAIRDYVEYRRVPTADDYGRKPLLTSPFGRYSKSVLNKEVYKWTAPCQHGEPCPAGRDPHGCEHTQTKDDMVACPYNTRPHDVRRGSITYYLTEDVPKELVSDRMDVSVKTLDRHYDQRSEQEKTETRRDYFT